MAHKPGRVQPPRQHPDEVWRPSGNLSRRMARVVFSTALMSALIVLAMVTVKAANDQRSRGYAHIEAAITEQRNASIAALDLKDAVRGAGVVERIGMQVGASFVALRDPQGAALAIHDWSADQAAAGRQVGGLLVGAASRLPEIPVPDMRVERVVDINGDHLGTIEVVVPSRPVVVNTLSYLLAGLLGLLAVLVAAAILARRMQAQIASPIQHLLETMDHVAHAQDYSLRAKPQGPDEVGSLIVSFNEMLHQIHTRNQRLAEHRRMLQELVVERTKSFERAAQEAERASRAKGDFLARMSHEIRTPMNGVVGMAELLENTRLEDQQHRMLQTMRSSADSLLSIINDILDFSRIEAGQLQVLETEFSPVELIEEVCELLAPRAHERSVEFVCDIDPSVPDSCGGDPIRVRQVVTNLLGNAIKYTEKGRIILRASASHKPGGKFELKVVVEDTGLGIAEDQLESIFDAFTQADTFESRKHGGTGLGLAITKQLLGILGGDIAVKSTLGAGSTFSVTVPLSTASGAGDSAEKWQPGVSTVLIVMEDEVAAKALEKLVAPSGAEVWSVQTGHRALERLALSQFGLVFVDEVLPDMTGYQFLDKLRATPAGAGLPVVMLTTSKPDAEKARRESQQSAPADARLPRPARRMQLHKAVDEALGLGASAESAGASRHGASLAIKVLLVEDSPVNREVANGMLEALGCTVETAGDGSIGSELAMSWGFDAILMDCQMPLMDGFEATRRIRSAEVAAGRKPMPIIALTANALQGDRERCLDAGMSDFVSKPFTMKKLYDALAEATSGVPRPDRVGAPPPAPVEPTAETLAIVEDVQPPIVDAAHIQELRSLGRPHIVHQAITMFQKQALQNLQEMEAACAASSIADIERAAHSLKSSSLSVGGRRFAAAASECEQAARRGALETAQRLAAQLRPEFATLCKGLAEVKGQENRAA